ncbi:ferritin-like domain-containing protein [Shewanella sp. YLB-07]|uniref:ferritin-like domain-containing protein n=1 Tax=Shewanella sp. YLB-07 TaxID=2601268 RepID=UPI00128D1238|nr:ferritin-like protein [Shewanella sp. YLB-07]MPY24570.1 hypothetical protein [Shewanella sp. YLB-07]
MSNQHQAPNSRSRHKLLPQFNQYPRCNKITDIVALRRHLQTAIEIEHATIPAYLCALYSIKVGSNAFAYQAIQSVVMEEMLHMILAANILNAIGGAPAINSRDFVPKYPGYLPHSDQAFLVPLQKLSRDTIEVFLKIEKPSASDAPAQYDEWSTIGQFYAAISEALTAVDASTEGGIFHGDNSKQLTENDYYGAGGTLFAVTNLTSALLAIEEIVGQGEGICDTIYDTDVYFGEAIDYAHYYKFNELKHERCYQEGDKPQDAPTGAPLHIAWSEVHNMQPNPKMADHPVGSPLWQQSRDFNVSYTALLDRLHDSCNGQPELIKQAIPIMFELKYKAQALMNTPLGNGMTAGPSFELIRDAW